MRVPRSRVWLCSVAVLLVVVPAVTGTYTDQETQSLAPAKPVKSSVVSVSAWTNAKCGGKPLTVQQGLDGKCIDIPSKLTGGIPLSFIGHCDKAAWKGGLYAGYGCKAKKPLASPTGADQKACVVPMPTMAGHVAVQVACPGSVVKPTPKTSSTNKAKPKKSTTTTTTTTTTTKKTAKESGTVTVQAWTNEACSKTPLMTKKAKIGTCVNVDSKLTSGIPTSMSGHCDGTKWTAKLYMGTGCKGKPMAQPTGLDGRQCVAPIPKLTKKVTVKVICPASVSKPKLTPAQLKALYHKRKIDARKAAYAKLAKSSGIPRVAVTTTVAAHGMHHSVTVGNVHAQPRKAKGQAPVFVPPARPKPKPKGTWAPTPAPSHEPKWNTRLGFRMPHVEVPTRKIPPTLPKPVEKKQVGPKGNFTLDDKTMAANSKRNLEIRRAAVGKVIQLALSKGQKPSIASMNAAENPFMTPEQIRDRDKDQANWHGNVERSQYWSTITVATPAPTPFVNQSIEALLKSTPEPLVFKPLPKLATVDKKLWSKKLVFTQPSPKIKKALKIIKNVKPAVDTSNDAVIYRAQAAILKKFAEADKWSKAMVTYHEGAVPARATSQCIAFRQNKHVWGSYCREYANECLKYSTVRNKRCVLFGRALKCYKRVLNVCVLFNLSCHKWIGSGVDTRCVKFGRAYTVEEMASAGLPEMREAELPPKPEKLWMVKSLSEARTQLRRTRDKIAMNKKLQDDKLNRPDIFNLGNAAQKKTKRVLSKGAKKIVRKTRAVKKKIHKISKKVGSKARSAVRKAKASAKALRAAAFQFFTRRRRVAIASRRRRSSLWARRRRRRSAKKKRKRTAKKVSVWARRRRRRSAKKKTVKRRKKKKKPAKKFSAWARRRRTKKKASNRRRRSVWARRRRRRH